MKPFQLAPFRPRYVLSTTILSVFLMLGGLAQSDSTVPLAMLVVPKANAVVYGKVLLVAQGQNFVDLNTVGGFATFSYFKDDQNKVKISVDNDHTNEFSAVWDTTQLSDGTYQLTVTLTDFFNNTASDQIQVMVDNANAPPNEDSTWIVRNEQTGKIFLSIQAAIDDAGTLDGHSIIVNSALYDSLLEPLAEPNQCNDIGPSCLIFIHKSVSLGSTDGAEQTILDGRSLESVVRILANDVTFAGFTIVRPQGVFAAHSGILVGAVSENQGKINNVKVVNNIVKGIDGVGIRVSRNTGSEITSNEIIDSGQGIRFEFTRDSFASENILTNSRIDDVFGSRNRIQENILFESTIFVNNSMDTVIVSNVIESNFRGGIRVESSEGIQVQSNDITGGFIGLDTTQSSDLLIVGNTIKGMFEFGIVLNESNDAQVRANFSTLNGTGIGQFGSFDIDVIANTLVGNDIGLRVENGEENSIRENKIQNNHIGIELSFLQNSQIQKNQIIATSETGIVLFNGSNNDVSDNVLQDGQDGILLRHSKDNQITNNVLDTFMGTAILLFDSSGDNTVGGSKIENATNGIVLIENSNENMLTLNEVNDGQTGIVIRFSQSNRLLNNTSQNNEQQGFLLEGATLNDLENNRSLANLIGIEVSRGQQNLIKNNLLQDNALGILQGNTNDNTIEGNVFMGNDQDKAKVTFVEGELLVRFFDQVPTVVIEALIRNLNTEVIPPFPIRRLYHLKILDDQDTLVKIEAFQKLPEVKTVGVNAVWAATALAPVKAPNDPTFLSNGLWNLTNINVLKAWEEGFTDSTNVCVAIFDTGIDTRHPDLAENIFKSERVKDEDLDPQIDEYGHGTFIAGIIAAFGNNGLWSVGIHWRACMIHLKLRRREGGVDAASTAAAIEKVVKMVEMGDPVRVVNFSYGGGGCNYFKLPQCAIVNQEELEFLSQAGVLFVTAAGNDGKDNESTQFFPCNYEVDNIICVASTNRNGVLENSNFGRDHVDLAAPGNRILSLISTTLEEGLEMDYVPNEALMGFANGTSFAAAHVTGVAGLLFSIYPDASYEQIKALILDNVKPLSALQGKVLSGGQLHWPENLPDKLPEK